MEIVKLKNGTEQPSTTVVAVMVALKNLWDTKPIVAFEFVSLCRDPSHQLFAGESDLRSAGLMQADGRVHETIRSTVLSAVSGEGLSMEIGSPYARVES